MGHGFGWVKLGMGGGGFWLGLRLEWVGGFVLVVVAVDIGVRLGCGGGWQWLALGVGCAVG